MEREEKGGNGEINMDKGKKERGKRRGKKRKRKKWKMENEKVIFLIYIFREAYKVDMDIEY